MATLSFSIPDVILPEAIEAFCNSYGYHATIPDPDHPGQTIPNPVTPGQFTQQCIINYGKEVVKGYQARVAAETARTTAANTAQSTLDAANITATLS